MTQTSFERFDTVVELIERMFSRYNSQSAYTCLGHTLSYSDVDRLSARFAYYLQHTLKLEPGDRIAIQLPNILQYPVALYGAIRAGLIIVNTNPLYTGRELKHQLKDSGAKALVVLANVADTAADIIHETEVETVIVTEIADLHPTPKRFLINCAVKYVKKMVPDFSFPNQVSFRSTVCHEHDEYTPVNAQPDDIVVLQYTGGTTGVAKGAMLTQKNLSVNAWQVTVHLKELFTSNQEIFVAPLPLYHIYAFNIHALAAASQGAQSLLIPNPRDLDSLVKAIQPYQMTVFIGLNTLFNALCRHEAFCQLDFSKLKSTAAGGMALTADIAEKWQQVTQCEICEGYGLTETSPVVCANQVGQNQPGTIGRPLPETDVKLVDEDGKDVPNGEPGELCVRGPQVMKGYWQRQGETDKVMLDNEWFKTGDIAVKREDGFFKIVDRKKDMILVSGFNVYPNEVEAVVMQHPAVVEAAVVGASHPVIGEAVKLFVVSSDPNLTKDELIDFCRHNLTGYKVPKLVEFRETLPKSNVGKILRRELRDAEPEKLAS